MTATVSMLVPLQTLFGWPEAPNVTALHALGLLAGIPLVVIVLVFAIAKGNAVVRASKLGAGPQPGDPVWLGGRSRSIMGGADDQLVEVEDRERRQLEASTTTSSDAGTGGASARW